MRILITGGLGFIGSSTAEKLLRMGHSVLSIDNLDRFYDPNIKLQNLDELNKYPLFKSEIFDVGQSDRLYKTMQSWKPEIVFHAAGKAGVRPSLESPESYTYSNIQVLTTLLETMYKLDIKKLVFCSSSSVYGVRKENKMTEDLPFDQAISYYAASKQCGEIINKMYHNLYDISVINLRFFTVYGPRQRPDLAIHKFLKAAINDETITLFGDGSMKRDYTFIDDIVEGVISSLDRVLQSEKSIYETYNLGKTSPISLSQLIKTIEKVSNREIRKKYLDVPKGDVPITYADISKARENLNFNPSTPIEEGIYQFYKWMLSRKDQDEIPHKLPEHEEPLSNLIHVQF